MPLSFQSILELIKQGRRTQASSLFVGLRNSRIFYILYIDSSLLMLHLRPNYLCGDVYWREKSGVLVSEIWFLFFSTSYFITFCCCCQSLQLCPTLCDPRDGSPPGSPVPGILQARTLEWVAISFSNAWKWKVEVKSFSHVWLLATPWTAAHQAPPSMGFARQEYWSGLPLPSRSY